MSSQQAQRLAIRCITLLQEAIERDFGLKVKMGAELEFMAYPLEPEKCADPTNPLNMPELEGKRDGALKAFFQQSPFITNTYKENVPFQYEVVFGHEQNHQLPVVLARAVDKTKGQILEYADKHGVMTSMEATFSNPNMKTWVRPNPITTGMHINLSLENKDGKNILGDKIVGNSLVNAALDMQAETILLHLPKPDSFRRIRSQHLFCRSPRLIGNDENESMQYRDYQKIPEDEDSPYIIDASGVKHNLHAAKFSPHIENRLCGADADPYQAVLSTLACTYDAISNESVFYKTEKGLGFLGDKEQAPQKVLRSRIPDNFDEAVDQFSKGTKFRNMLNRLSGEEKLGDRLCDAVLEDAKVAHLQPKLESRRR